jgi:bacillithiol system protein YtxJ
MNWIDLDSSEQLEKLIADSNNQSFVIFKHSTRCSISSMAKNRLERQASQNIQIPFYFLDLLAYRSISNAIAEKLNVPHESPQLLLIENGQCTFSSSHGAIDMEELKEAVSRSQN